jgi:hypothetical protein
MRRKVTNLSRRQGAKRPREDAKSPLLATEGFKAPSFFFLNFKAPRVQAFIHQF